MIGSLRTASEFHELRSTGRRSTHGPLTMIASTADGLSDSRVAYAVGRGVGNAVQRNRLRRRLRAILFDLDRQGRLPVYRYLVICRPPAVDFGHSQLISCVERVLDELQVAA